MQDYPFFGGVGGYKCVPHMRDTTRAYVRYIV